MNKNDRILDYDLAHNRVNTKQLLSGLMIALNLIVIGPGSFVVREVYYSSKHFREETEYRLLDLEKAIAHLQESCEPDAVTTDEFSHYREQMIEQLRYLDSKIAESRLEVERALLGRSGILNR